MSANIFVAIDFLILSQVLPVRSYQYKLIPGSRRKHAELPLFVFDCKASIFHQYNYPYDDLPPFTLDVYPFHSVHHCREASWSDDASSPISTVMLISLTCMTRIPDSFGDQDYYIGDDGSDSDDPTESAVSAHSDLACVSVEGPKSDEHPYLTKRTENRISSWFVTLQNEKPLPVAPLENFETDDDESMSVEMDDEAYDSDTDSEMESA